MSDLPDLLPQNIATTESARALWFSRATLIGAIVLASLGWLIVAAVRPSAARSELLVGLFLGTLFGQVAASAAWLPLGPLRLPLRIGLACAWLAATLIAVAINLSLDRARLDELVVISLGVGVQWLLIQTPIWAAVWLYGLRIAHAMDPQTGPGNRQFGIRQLMILTAIIGVLLGLGRLVLTSVTWLEGNRNWLEGFLIFGFFAAANALLAFPILAAALLPRFAGLASFAMLVLVAALVVVEVPLFETVAGIRGPDIWWIFGGMNFGYCLWVLAYVGVLRLGSYRLVSR